MAYEALQFERSGGVARITIANEANNNAVGHQFCREFALASLDITSDPDVRAVVIEGRGKFFCMGGDLKEFLSQAERVRAHVRDMATHFHVALVQLRNGTAPVIIAVNGMAAGGGFSLVLNADIAIAKRSAKLVPAYSRSGLSPDAGGTWFLPRLVGLQRAFDMFATNPTLTADEAMQLGIVSRVVDDAMFDAEVDKVVQSILATPPGALASLKKLLRQSASATLEQQLVAEADALADCASLPTTLEKLREFAARSARR